MLSIQSAQASAVPAIATLHGTAPTFASAGQVKVEVLAQPHVLHPKVGQVEHMITLVAPRAIGRSFSVAVPDSSAVRALASQNNGSVNLFVVTFAGRQMSGVMQPAKVGGVAAGASATASAGPAVLRLSKFPKPAAAAGKSTSAQPQVTIPVCTPAARVIRTWNNQPTRIGQLHVAASSGMEGDYIYSTKADSTVTAGVSLDSPNGGFSNDGTVSVGNSIGAGSTLPEGSGKVVYVDDSMEYQELNVCSGLEYIMEAVSSEGDTFAGTNTPAANPYGSCNAAKSHGWGVATISHGTSSTPGTWHADHTQITTFDAGTTLLGFSLTEHTGYSTTNMISYVNRSTTANTYVCGAKSPVQNSFVLYNNPI